MITPVESTVSVVPTQPRSVMAEAEDTARHLLQEMRHATDHEDPAYRALRLESLAQAVKSVSKLIDSYQLT